MRAGRIAAVLLATAALVLILGGWAASHFHRSPSPPADNAHTNWQRAQEAIADQEFPQAAAHLAYCLESWPYNAEAHFLMARTSRRSGQLAQWKVHLDRAEILRWPKNQIDLERKLRRAQVGDIWEVETSLLELVNKLPPDEVVILDALVNGYMENDCLLDVMALTTTWIKRFPKDSLPLIYRGNAELRLFGKPAEAVKDFQRVLDLKPNQPDAHLALGLVLANDGQFKEAIPHFQFYLDRRPDDPAQALLGLANCQFSMGKTDQAREVLNQLFAQVKDEAGGVFLMAKIEAAEGRHQEALRWLKKADDRSPNQADVTNTLVHVCVQLGLKEETARYKERLEEIHQRDEALERLVSEAKLRPDDPDVRFQLGTLCLKYGRTEEAAHWFQGILRKDPKHLPTLNTLAVYYDSKGKHRLANRYRRKAVEASGGSVTPSSEGSAR